MVRCLEGRKAKTISQMTTNAGESQKSVVTPATQGFHCQGEEENARIVAVVLMDCSLTMFCNSKSGTLGGCSLLESLGLKWRDDGDV